MGVIGSMQVTVETLGHGFLINVFSDKSCPGLLVSILEAFDELGLNVLEATASCDDTFRLEAVGGDVRNKNSIIDVSSLNWPSIYTLLLLAS